LLVQAFTVEFTPALLYLVAQKFMIGLVLSGLDMLAERPRFFQLALAAFPKLAEIDNFSDEPLPRLPLTALYCRAS